MSFSRVASTAPVARGPSGARLAALLTLLALSCFSVARAQAPQPSAEDLSRVQAAIERGAFSDAIAQLELWSDQGIVHPDASFDRGVAYLGRAESPARRSADLGQAAAGFEEALFLDPDDEEARLVLERIRASVAERRAKANDDVVARPRLLRALLGLIGENVWALLAAIGSLSLTLGLAARFWSGVHRVRLAGGIGAVSGALLLALGAGMAVAGWRLRVGASPAVVIVEEARLHDAEGHPLRSSRGPSTLGEAGDRAPEGTLVHISDARGALVQIEWGDGHAWLSARDVRRLERPR